MRPCPHRPTATAPPRRPCWATRSARTSRARRRASPTADALVSRHQERAPDLRASSTRPSTASAAGLLRAGHRARRPRRDLGAQLRRSGWSSSTRPREGRRDPRQRQPGLPHARARVRAAPVGRAAAVQRRARSRPATTRAMIDEVARRPDALERVVFVDRAEWDGRCAGDARPRRDRRAHGRAVLRRPDQHPVHERHDRAFPRARRSRTTTSSTTASSSPSCIDFTEARPRRACRCPSTTASAWSWATSGALATARCVVIPAPSFEPARDARGGRGRGACTSLYGVPTMFIAMLDHADFADVRPELAAHGDHGRLAVPGRGHEARASRHAHGARWPSATA